MANTFTQIHIHAIFAVKYRHNLIQNDWKQSLYKYIAGIISKNNHKLLAINGMPDHIHLLFSMRPVQSLSDLMKDIKGCSSKWINENKFVKYKFEWQIGYGAFAYSKSQIPIVINYIENQEIHHKNKSFVEEYQKILEELNIDFNEKFIFKLPS